MVFRSPEKLRFLTSNSNSFSFDRIKLAMESNLIVMLSWREALLNCQLTIGLCLSPALKVQVMDEKTA